MTAPLAARRLTAIMAADVVGYTRLMQRDEDGTLARLKAHRKELFEPLVETHRGRTVKLMGDGALCEFASVVDAVRCAVLSQRALDERERDIPEADRIRLRIAINLGDVIHDEGDLYGDGVNIAARLQQLAEPGGILVSGTAYDHLQGKLDLPLDPIGEQRVKNVDRPIRAYRVRLNGTRRRGSLVRRSWRLLVLVGAGVMVALGGAWWAKPILPMATGKPSIAVLPFADLGGEGNDEYLADGITDDLITDLAQIAGLTVIAHNSVFAYKGRSSNLQEVARDLDARYVVEGSVRRTGDRLRINAQLIDATTGAHLWAEGFDRRADDILEVENDVLRQIVARLPITLSPSEQARLDRLPTTNLEAYDSFLRAERAARSGLRPRLSEALSLYAKATELDPSFTEAYAAHARTAAYVWAKDYDDTLQASVARRQAFELASRAVRLDPNAPLPYAVLAVLQIGDRRFEEAIVSARRAVALGPSDADAHSALGLVLTFAGEHAEAMRAVDEALRLDPAPATGDALTAGLAYSLGGRHGRAIDVLEQARAATPLNAEVTLALSVIYVRAGRMAEARAAAAETIRLDPRLNIELYRILFGHFREDRDLAAILDAMLAAGIPRWPFGSNGDGAVQLSGGEIAQLAIGRTWQGHTEIGEPAFFQFARDGRSVFRTSTMLETGTAFVDGNLLCDQSDSALLGRPRCWPISRTEPEGNEESYLYLNAHKALRFSPVRSD